MELWHERDFGECATPPERYDVPAVRNEGPTRNSGSAQELIVFICFGVGMLIGTFVNVELIE